MLAEGLLTLAAQAGWTMVAAAATDVWDTARYGFVDLLGRGDPKQTQLAEQRLEETREQLTGAARTNTGEVRAALAERWAGRLADLLEEEPDAARNLRVLVEEIQAALPVRTVSASDNAVTAEGDMDLRAAYAGMVGGATGAGATAAGDQPAGLIPRSEGVGSGRADTLAERVGLASWIGQAGDAAGARDQFAALLPVCERVLGAEHRDTLAAGTELAYWSGQAGDAAGARDQFAALLPVCERVLGAEHRDTLAAGTELAYWSGAGGGCGGGAGSVRRAAAGVRAGARCRAPRHPDQPPPSR